MFDDFRLGTKISEFDKKEAFLAFQRRRDAAANYAEDTFVNKKAKLDVFENVKLRGFCAFFDQTARSLTLFCQTQTFLFPKISGNKNARV